MASPHHFELLSEEMNPRQEATQTTQKPNVASTSSADQPRSKRCTPLRTNSGPDAFHGFSRRSTARQESTPSAASTSSVANDEQSPDKDRMKGSPSSTFSKKPSSSASSKKKKKSSRKKKASFYHRVAAKNRLGAICENPIIEGDEEDDEHKEEDSLDMDNQENNKPPSTRLSRVRKARKELLAEVNRMALDQQDNGKGYTTVFQSSLQALTHEYDSSKFDPRIAPKIRRTSLGPSRQSTPREPLQLEGIGIAAGKPSFQGCVGRNHDGDPMFKLGTMSFEMFRPTELVLSVQGTFTSIEHVHRKNLHKVKHVPKNLMADVRYGTNPVRTYNIVTAFTIEPWKPEFGDRSPNKIVTQPIRGVMTTYGFILPYPTQKHRFSVWFTGGSLEVDDPNNKQWFTIFGGKAPQRTLGESSKLLAAKLLMGACVNDQMDQDGKLAYALTRPMSNYIDLIYLDKSLAALRGSSGMVYVNVRVPGLTSEILLDPSPARCNEMISSAAKDSLLFNEDSSDFHCDEEHSSSSEGEDDEEKSTASSAAGRVPGFHRAPSRKRAMSESGALETSQKEQHGAAASRLAELQSFANLQPQKSSLKRTSSYGNMEEIGTGIPINRKRAAWKVLPKPEKPRKESLKIRGPALKRTLSDPSELLSVTSKLKFPSTESVTTTDTEAESCSEAPEEECEDEESVPPTTSLPERRLRQSVSFSSLDVRRYDQTVGDNPSCKGGVPISLDWTYQSEIRVDLNAIERAKERRKWEVNLKRLTAAERKEKLRKEFGVDSKEIKAAMVEAQRVREQRQFTNRYRASLSAIKVEGALEAVQRKAMGFTKLWKSPKQSGN